MGAIILDLEFILFYVSDSLLLLNGIIKFIIHPSKRFNNNWMATSVTTRKAVIVKSFTETDN